MELIRSVEFIEGLIGQGMTAQTVVQHRVGAAGLSELSCHPQHCEDIVKRGGLSALLHILETAPDPVARRTAAFALGNVTASPSRGKMAATEGLGPRMLKVLRRGELDLATLYQLCRACAHLCEASGGARCLGVATDVATAVVRACAASHIVLSAFACMFVAAACADEAVGSRACTDDSVVTTMLLLGRCGYHPTEREAVRALRVLAAYDGGIDNMLKRGLVDVLLSLAGMPDVATKYEVACAFEVVSRRKHHRRLVAARAMATVISLAMGDDAATCYAAATALTHLLDNASCHSAFLENGGLAMLQFLYASAPDEAGLAVTVKACAQLGATREGATALAGCDLLPSTVAQLQHPSPEAAYFAAVTVSNLCIFNESVERVVALPVIAASARALLSVPLDTSNQSPLTILFTRALLFALLQLSARPDCHAAVLAQEGLVALKFQLANEDAHARTVAASACANIARNVLAHAAIIRAALIPSIAALLDDPAPQVQRSAVLAVRALSRTPDAGVLLGACQVAESLARILLASPDAAIMADALATTCTLAADVTTHAKLAHPALFVMLFKLVTGRDTAVVQLAASALANLLQSRRGSQTGAQVLLESEAEAERARKRKAAARDGGLAEEDVSRARRRKRGNGDGDGGSLDDSVEGGSMLDDGSVGDGATTAGGGGGDNEGGGDDDEEDEDNMSSLSALAYALRAADAVTLHCLLRVLVNLSADPSLLELLLSKENLLAALTACLSTGDALVLHLALACLHNFMLLPRSLHIFLKNGMIAGAIRAARSKFSLPQTRTLAMQVLANVAQVRDEACETALREENIVAVCSGLMSESELSLRRLAALTVARCSWSPQLLMELTASQAAFQAVPLLAESDDRNMCSIVSSVVAAMSFVPSVRHMLFARGGGAIVAHLIRGVAALDVTVQRLAAATLANFFETDCVPFAVAGHLLSALTTAIDVGADASVVCEALRGVCNAVQRPAGLRGLNGEILPRLTAALHGPSLDAAVMAARALGNLSAGFCPSAIPAGIAGNPVTPPPAAASMSEAALRAAAPGLKPVPPDISLDRSESLTLLDCLGAPQVLTAASAVADASLHPVTGLMQACCNASAKCMPLPPAMVDAVLDMLSHTVGVSAVDEAAAAAAAAGGAGGATERAGGPAAVTSRRGNGVEGGLGASPSTVMLHKMTAGALLNAAASFSWPAAAATEGADELLQSAFPLLPHLCRAVGERNDHHLSLHMQLALRTLFHARANMAMELREQHVARTVAASGGGGGSSAAPGTAGAAAAGGSGAGAAPPSTAAASSTRAGFAGDEAAEKREADETTESNFLEDGQAVVYSALETVVLEHLPSPAPDLLRAVCPVLANMAVTRASALRLAASGHMRTLLHPESLHTAHSLTQALVALANMSCHADAGAACVLAGLGVPQLLVALQRSSSREGDELEILRAAGALACSLPSKVAQFPDFVAAIGQMTVSVMERVRDASRMAAYARIAAGAVLLAVFQSASPDPAAYGLSGAQLAFVVNAALPVASVAERWTVRGLAALFASAMELPAVRASMRDAEMMDGLRLLLPSAVIDEDASVITLQLLRGLTDELRLRRFLLTPPWQQELQLRLSLGDAPLSVKREVMALLVNISWHGTVSPTLQPMLMYVCRTLLVRATLADPVLHLLAVRWLATLAESHGMHALLEEAGAGGVSLARMRLVRKAREEALGLNGAPVPTLLSDLSRPVNPREDSLIPAAVLWEAERFACNVTSATSSVPSLAALGLPAEAIALWRTETRVTFVRVLLLTIGHMLREAGTASICTHVQALSPAELCRSAFMWAGTDASPALAAALANFFSHAGVSMAPADILPVLPAVTLLLRDSLRTNTSGGVHALANFLTDPDSHAPTVAHGEGVIPRLLHDYMLAVPVRAVMKDGMRAVQALATSQVGRDSLYSPDLVAKLNAIGVAGASVDARQTAKAASVNTVAEAGPLPMSLFSPPFAHASELSGSAWLASAGLLDLTFDLLVLGNATSIPSVEGMAAPVAAAFLDRIELLYRTTTAPSLLRLARLALCNAFVTLRGHLGADIAPVFSRVRYVIGDLAASTLPSDAAAALDALVALSAEPRLRPLLASITHEVLLRDAERQQLLKEDAARRGVAAEHAFAISVVAGADAHTGPHQPHAIVHAGADAARAAEDVSPEAAALRPEHELLSTLRNLLVEFMSVSEVARAVCGGLIDRTSVSGAAVASMRQPVPVPCAINSAILEGFLAQKAPLTIPENNAAHPTPAPIPGTPDKVSAWVGPRDSASEALLTVARATANLIAAGAIVTPAVLPPSEGPGGDPNAPTALLGHSAFEVLPGMGSAFGLAERAAAAASSGTGSYGVRTDSASSALRAGAGSRGGGGGGSGIGAVRAMRALAQAQAQAASRTGASHGTPRMGQTTGTADWPVVNGVRGRTWTRHAGLAPVLRALAAHAERSVAWREGHAFCCPDHDTDAMAPRLATVLRPTSDDRIAFATPDLAARHRGGGGGTGTGPGSGSAGAPLSLNDLRQLALTDRVAAVALHLDRPPLGPLYADLHTDDPLLVMASGYTWNTAAWMAEPPPTSALRASAAADAAAAAAAAAAAEGADAADAADVDAPGTARMRGSKGALTAPPLPLTLPTLQAATSARLLPLHRWLLLRSAAADPRVRLAALAASFNSRLTVPAARAVSGALICAGVPLRDATAPCHVQPPAGLTGAFPGLAATGREHDPSATGFCCAFHAATGHAAARGLHATFAQQVSALPLSQVGGAGIDTAAGAGPASSGSGSGGGSGSGFPASLLTSRVTFTPPHLRSRWAFSREESSLQLLLLRMLRDSWDAPGAQSMGDRVAWMGQLMALLLHCTRRQAVELAPLLLMALTELLTRDPAAIHAVLRVLHVLPLEALREFTGVIDALTRHSAVAAAGQSRDIATAAAAEPALRCAVGRAPTDTARVDFVADVIHGADRRNGHAASLAPIGSSRSRKVLASALADSGWAFGESTARWPPQMSSAAAAARSHALLLPFTCSPMSAVNLQSFDALSFATGAQRQLSAGQLRAAHRFKMFTYATGLVTARAAWTALSTVMPDPVDVRATLGAAALAPAAARGASAGALLGHNIPGMEISVRQLRRRGERAAAARSRTSGGVIAELLEHRKHEAAGAAPLNSSPAARAAAMRALKFADPNAGRASGNTRWRKRAGLPLLDGWISHAMPLDGLLPSLCSLALSLSMWGGPVPLPIPAPNAALSKLRLTGTAHAYSSAAGGAGHAAAMRSASAGAGVGAGGGAGAGGIASPVGFGGLRSRTASAGLPGFGGFSPSATHALGYGSGAGPGGGLPLHPGRAQSPLHLPHPQHPGSPAAAAYGGFGGFGSPTGGGAGMGGGAGGGPSRHRRPAMPTVLLSPAGKGPAEHAAAAQKLAWAAGALPLPSRPIAPLSTTEMTTLWATVTTFPLAAIHMPLYGLLKTHATLQAQLRAGQPGRTPRDLGPFAFAGAMGGYGAGRTAGSAFGYGGAGAGGAGPSGASGAGAQPPSLAHAKWQPSYLAAIATRHPPLHSVLGFLRALSLPRWSSEAPGAAATAAGQRAATARAAAAAAANASSATPPSFSVFPLWGAAILRLGIHRTLVAAAQAPPVVPPLDSRGDPLPLTHLPLALQRARPYFLPAAHRKLKAAIAEFALWLESQARRHGVRIALLSAAVPSLFHSAMALQFGSEAAVQRLGAAALLAVGAGVSLQPAFASLLSGQTMDTPDLWTTLTFAAAARHVADDPHLPAPADVPAYVRVVLQPIVTEHHLTEAVRAACERLLCIAAAKLRAAAEQKALLRGAGLSGVGGIAAGVISDGSESPAERLLNSVTAGVMLDVATLGSRVYDSIAASVALSTAALVLAHTMPRSTTDEVMARRVCALALPLVTVPSFAAVGQIAFALTVARAPYVADRLRKHMAEEVLAFHGRANRASLEYTASRRGLALLLARLCLDEAAKGAVVSADEKAWTAARLLASANSGDAPSIAVMASAVTLQLAVAGVPGLGTASQPLPQLLHTSQGRWATALAARTNGARDADYGGLLVAATLQAAEEWGRGPPETLATRGASAPDASSLAFRQARYRAMLPHMVSLTPAQASRAAAVRAALAAHLRPGCWLHSVYRASFTPAAVAGLGAPAGRMGPAWRYGGEPLLAASPALEAWLAGSGLRLALMERRLLWPEFDLAAMSFLAPRLATLLHSPHLLGGAADASHSELAAAAEATTQTAFALSLAAQAIMRVFAKERARTGGVGMGLSGASLPPLLAALLPLLAETSAEGAAHLLECSGAGDAEDVGAVLAFYAARALNALRRLQPLRKRDEAWGVRVARRLRNLQLHIHPTGAAAIAELQQLMGVQWHAVVSRVLP